MDAYIDGSRCMDEQALDIEKMHSSEILRYRHKKKLAATPLRSLYGNLWFGGKKVDPLFLIWSLKRKSKTNLGWGPGGNLLCEGWRISPKIVLKLSWTYKSLTVKETHISSAVSEVLLYRQTQILYFYIRIKQSIEYTWI